MVIAAPEPKATLQPTGEQRVVFRGISWDAYLQILAVLPRSRGSRLTYDDGVLEITMPLEDHEFAGRLIERFHHRFGRIVGSVRENYGFDHNESPHAEERSGARQCLLLSKSAFGKGKECKFFQRSTTRFGC